MTGGPIPATRKEVPGQHLAGGQREEQAEQPRDLRRRYLDSSVRDQDVRSKQYKHLASQGERDWWTGP